MDEYLHLMPSSRARLGSLPWALCVRTLHRPFRSSRHRDISFNRGPASFRQDPGVTFSVSSSGRLWFCGDKNTERKTRSRVNQDRAFQGNIQFNFKLWKYNEAPACHICHWRFERMVIFTFKCYYGLKECVWSVISAFYAAVWEELSEFGLQRWWLSLTIVKCILIQITSVTHSHLSEHIQTSTTRRNS